MNTNPISNSSPTSSLGGVSREPLLLYKPANLLVLISFLSPVIIAVCIVSLSFVFQNFKGIIYLAFLIAAALLREFIFMNSNNFEKSKNDNTICSAVQFSSIGNSTFSVFVSFFTIMYLSLPMFVNNSINWPLFSVFLFFIFIDIFIKVYQGCIIIAKNSVQLFLDSLLGLAFAAIITSLMYAGGSGKFLFFNETSNNRQVCSMPKKQTFKCAVYKNGELLSNL